MFQYKFIILILVCGLQSPYFSSAQIDMETSLLFLSFLTGNLTSPQIGNCEETNLTCILNLSMQSRLGNNDTDSNSTGPRIISINPLADFIENYQPRDPPATMSENRVGSTELITELANSTRATPSGQIDNVTTQQRFSDFSTCGAFPACSVDHLSEDLWNFTCDKPIVSFIAAMAIILCNIIVISNTLIITVTLLTKSLRKPHGYFKLSLAVADMIAGAFVLPSIIHNTLNTIDFNKRVYTSYELAFVLGADVSNSPTAIFFGVCGVLSTITAVYSLLLLSVDSFLSVRWPMKYRIGDIMTTRRAIGAVLFVWIFSTAVAFLPVLAKNYIEYGLSHFTFQYIPFIRPAGDKSDPIGYRFLHIILYATFVWAIPFAVTWVLTVMTSMQSRRMLQNMREARRRSVRSANALNKVDRELVRTVSVVLTLFTLTILPVFGVTIVQVIDPPDLCFSQGYVIAFFSTTYMLICGRFLNVIIYNVLNKDFRDACIKFFADVARNLFNYDGLNLPKRSESTRKSASFWRSGKGKRGCSSKYRTKQSGLSIKSHSAPRHDSSGPLSPMTDTSTVRNKLSISSIDTTKSTPDKVHSCSSVSSVLYK